MTEDRKNCAKLNTLSALKSGDAWTFIGIPLHAFVVMQALNMSTEGAVPVLEIYCQYEGEPQPRHFRVTKQHDLTFETVFVGFADYPEMPTKNSGAEPIYEETLP